MEFKAFRTRPGEEGEAGHTTGALCAGSTMVEDRGRAMGDDVDRWKRDCRIEIQVAVALLESERVDDRSGERRKRQSEQRKCQSKKEGAGQVADEILEEKGHAGAARESALLRIAQRVASLLLISCTLGQDTVFNDLLLGGRMTGHIFFFFFLIKKIFFFQIKNTHNKVQKL